MKNTSKIVTTICEVCIFAAFGFVFDILQGVLLKGVFTSGGSIGFAMIAVLIMAYRRGFLPALLTGLIMGLLDLATGAYILHPVQLILDYITPYSLVAIAGLLKPFFDKCKDNKSKILWLIAGTFIGGFCKFLSHYLSGVIFFSNPKGFAWELNGLSPYLYSFIYNIAYMGPCILITGALIVPLYLKAPQVFNTTDFTSKQFVEEAEEKEKKDYIPLIGSTALMASGLFLFIFFLIKYVNSFYTYDDMYYESPVFGYDFDPDSMLIFVLGFFIIVLGIIALVTYSKKKFSYIVISGALMTTVFVSFIYGTARLIRCYIKEKDPTTYWIWFGVGLFTLLVAIALFVISIIKKKKQNSD